MKTRHMRSYTAALLLGALALPGGARGGQTRGEQLQAAAERMHVLPWHASWLDALEARLDRNVRAASEAERRARLLRSWVDVGDGYLSRRSLKFDLQWNRSAPDRERPRYADIESDGHPFGAIVDFHRQLAEHDVTLLVVPVPLRAHLYPELVLDDAAIEATDWSAFAGYAPGLTGFLLALEEAGVATVDVLSLLAGERWGTGEEPEEVMCLKYNVHWSPRAALTVAKEVANRILDLGVERGSLREGKDWVVTKKSTPWLPPSLRIAPPKTVPQELDFEHVRAPEGGELNTTSDTSPVLLIGDSFANHFSPEEASFERQLFRALAQPIDTILIRGGGAEQTRRALARRPEATGAFSKRVVVWLFNSAALTESEWNVIPMQREGER